MSQTDITVAVLSYDRIDLLERTLRAALAQQLPSGVSYDIVVADNHPDRLAEPLVDRLRAGAQVPIRYVANPVRNISVIRNVSIDAARGSTYCAFVDDDEKPDPDWLGELHACMERTGADAAFGPKYPEFESGRAPDWDPQGWYFTCDFRMPPDSPIHLFGRLRKRGKGLGSGNSIFRMATAFATAAPFNEAFGNAGGEDTEMFFRMTNEGMRFVWCPGAKVREFMQSTRANYDYMRTRLKRGSQHYAASRLANSHNKMVARAKIAGIGIAQILVHGGLYVLRGDFLSRNRVANRLGIAKGLGKLTYRAPIGFIEEKR